MKKSDLIKLLNNLGVSRSNYSLDGELIPGNMVVYNSYRSWIVFYLDERGNRNEIKEFNTESDALEYLYNSYLELKKFEDY